MHSSTVVVALLLAITLLLTSSILVTAQGFGEGEIGPHRDILVRSVFPDFPDGKFPVGEVVDVLIALRNNNEKITFNVTTAAAQLTNPLDFSVSFFNFSGFQYNRPLAPGQEAALVYKFRSDPAMEPRDFGLKLNLVYFDQYQHPFLHLAFNDTISFVESVNSFDFESLFAFLLVAAVLAVGGYFGYKTLFKGKKQRGSSSAAGKSGASSPASRETGTAKVAVNKEFVDPRVAKHMQKNGPATVRKLNRSPK